MKGYHKEKNQNKVPGERENSEKLLQTRRRSKSKKTKSRNNGSIRAKPGFTKILWRKKTKTRKGG